MASIVLGSKRSSNRIRCTASKTSELAADAAQGLNILESNNKHHRGLNWPLGCFRRRLCRKTWISAKRFAFPWRSYIKSNNRRPFSPSIIRLVKDVNYLLLLEFRELEWAFIGREVELRQSISFHTLRTKVIPHHNRLSHYAGHGMNSRSMVRLPRKE